MFKVIELYNIKPKHKHRTCLGIPNYEYNSVSMLAYVPEIFLKHDYKLQNLYDTQYLLDELTLFRKEHKIKDRLEMSIHGSGIVIGHPGKNLLQITPVVRRGAIAEILIELRVNYKSVYNHQIKYDSGIKEIFVREIIESTGNDEVLKVYNELTSDTITDTIPKSAIDTVTEPVIDTVEKSNINKVLVNELLDILYQN